jgi:hypothetical protein
MISESVISRRLEYSCCQRRAVLAFNVGAARKITGDWPLTGDWPFRGGSGLASEIVMLA